MSSNAVFCDFARRFCIEEDIIQKYHVGPAVHQRRIAAVLWLTLGSPGNLDIPRKQLLASCETVLRTRPDIIKKAQSTIKSVHPNQIDQLELLLSKPRSTQVLMDYTLSVDRVLGPENIDEVMALMRRTAAEDIEKEATERIKKIKVRSVTDQQKLQKEVERYKSQLEIAETIVQDRESADLRMLNRWITVGKQMENRFIRGQKVAFVLLAVIIFVFSIYIYSVTLKSIFLLLVGIIISLCVFILALWPMFHKFPNVLDSFIRRRQAELLWRRAHEAGREDLLSRFDVDWENAEVTRRGEAERRLRLFD